MTAITDLITHFSSRERPIGTLLTADVLLALAEAAARYYFAYAALASQAEVITETTDLTSGEWAIIKPLFLLYVERENAIYLESSRGLGLDVYGRSVAEVIADITTYQLELPKLAFCSQIITV